MLIRRFLTYSLLSLIALGGFFGNLQIDKGTQTESHIVISYVGNGVYAADGGETTIMLNGKEVDNTAPTKPADNTKLKSQLDDWNKVIDTLNMALAVISALVSPIILFVGWLMSPDWTSGDLFGLRTPMYSLWVTVSNIVYFIYAIMLILIALGTMFGNDKFSYKVMLPKLALGILMVPFTWWFVQWTISISAVVTASVMTIPQETIDAMEGQNPSAWYSKNVSIPKQISIGGDENKKTEPCSESTCITPKQFLSKSAGMYGPLVVYAYSIFKFENITRLDGPADVATAIAKVVHTSIISTIMFFVFGLLVLALATMLIMRAVKLWAYAIFAPLFTFQFVAGSVGSDKDMFSIKEFIGLCFVPAVVGLSLSFGLIMIAAVQGTGGAGGDKGTKCDLVAEGCTILNIMGSAENNITRKWTLSGSMANDKAKDYTTSTVFKWGDMSVNFMGKAVNQTDTKSTASGTIDSLGGMFGTLIIDIIALVFIWLAFMAAKNVSKAVAGAIEPFEKIGSQVGNLAKSLPKYTPLPIPGGSISGATKAVGLAESAISSASDKRFADSGIGKMLNADKYTSKEKDTKLVEAIKSKDLQSKDIFQKYWKEEASKEYFYKSESVKALATELKGMNSDAQKEYLTKKGITSMDKQNEIREFISTDKGNLSTDTNQKAFVTLMNGAIGSASSGGNNGGTSNFNFKINTSESMQINPAGTATEIAKQLAGNTLITEKLITDSLKATSLETKTDEILKAFKEIKKTKSS